MPPPGPAWESTASEMIDTSMKAEPVMVKMKNLVAAYTRRPWPQRPIRKYSGTMVSSNIRKNRKRSRLMNTPRQPASSSVIQR